MNLDVTVERLRVACVEHFGDQAGRRLAALARPGFDLDVAGAGAPATGRCVLGGPALLEPGTPWPEYDGLPLSPLAVLDTDALAGWLGEHLPRRAGLLNIFVLEPAGTMPYREVDLADPRWLRVVPADPARAVGVPAPAAATAFERIPLHAVPLLTMPDEWSDAVQGVDFGDDNGMAVATAVADFYASCPEVAEEPGAWTAFGWLAGELGEIHTWRDSHTHLLTLRDGPSNWPTLYFSIPTEAFQAGDFSQAVVTQEAY